MMLYASSHFNRTPGSDIAPSAVSAAPLPVGTSDQDRIISAVKRVEPSVVALNVAVNGTQVVPADPFAQFFFGGTQTGPHIQHFHARASGSGFVSQRNGNGGYDRHQRARRVIPPQGQGTVSKNRKWSSPTAIAKRGTVYSANLGADPRVGESGQLREDASAA